MFFSQRIQHLRRIYREYPQQFWLLVGASFIDHLGGALIWPFFTLYITRRFGISMTSVGLIFGIFSLTNLISSTIGGALTDRMGRKGLVIFGLVTSAAITLAMGLANTLPVFLVAAIAVGLFADVAGPAHNAMVADLLPEEQRADGYGILRVMANLAMTIGPAVGGFLATRSYLLLFATDAVASTITAVIVFLFLRETMPVHLQKQVPESLAHTFRGYGQALRDRTYMLFLMASTFTTLVYIQMYSTLSVFLRDVRGVDEQGFGFIFTLNAAMVVLMQFAITRRIKRFAPMMVMVVGTALYAVGFGLYGFVTVYPLYLAAIAIITIGEMVVVPVAQALVARLSPEAMRGRYMAVYGFSWIVPSALGPLFAGLIMDNIDPRWVWYGAFIVGVLAALIFLRLAKRPLPAETT